MSIKITDMTPDASVSGVELIPVSDAGAPKSVTITNIKDFVVDAIEAIAAATTAPLTDYAYILQSSALKPVLLSTIAQSVIDSVWAKADYTPAAGTDKMILKTGSTEKTVTLTNLAEYIRSLVEATILDVSNLSAASALADADMLLLTVGTTGKKVLWSVLKSAIYDALAAYLTALSAVTASAETDVFYCLQGGVQKKATLAQLKAGMDFVIPPASTTENKVPQWGSTSKTLKDGLTLRTEARVSDEVDDSSLMTEKLISSLVDTVLEIWIPATAMVPSAVDGAGETAGQLVDWAEYASNSLTYPCLIFDGSTQDENAEFNLVMPPGWDLGTIMAKVFWAPGHADANAGEYVRFKLAAGALSNDDAIDTALGTQQTMDDIVLADDDLHITPASDPITVGGTPALGDLIHFKLTRDYDYAGAGSAMDVDARVFGVLIQIAKTQPVEAW